MGTQRDVTARLTEATTPRLLLPHNEVKQGVSHKEEATWQYSLKIADQPRPPLKFNYERFNCNNFKIRY